MIKSLVQCLCGKNQKQKNYQQKQQNPSFVNFQPNLGNNLQFQCIILNQTALPKASDDKRKHVKQPFQNYPHKYIGKLITYFTNNQENQKPHQGTAFFVGEGVLLTVAHNLYNANNQLNKLKHNNKYDSRLQTPKSIYFYPSAPKGKKQIRLKVKSYQKHPKYETCVNEQYGSNIYDLALLELDLNQMKKYKQFIPEGYLKINYEIQLKKNKRIQILAAGFPKQINVHPESFYLYSQIESSYEQDFNYIYYKHQTSGGQSGMALFQIIKQNTYKLIGIHKAQMKFKQKKQNNKFQQKKKTFGLTFSQFIKEQISLMAQELKVQQRLKQNYQISKKRLLKERKKQIKLINKSNYSLTEILNKQEQQIYDTKHVNKLIDKKQYKQAFQLANKAVIKQSVQAFGDLARIYLRNVQKKNPQKAYKLAKKGAEFNQSNSQYILGQCYYYGYEVKKDYKKSVQFYKKAAEQGLSYAQLLLGYSYHKGEGTEKDYQKSVQYFTKAAEQGNAAAQNNLGVCYQNGQGVEKDCKKAAQLYKKAIEQNYQIAKNNLKLLNKNNNIKKQII